MWGAVAPAGAAAKVSEFLPLSLQDLLPWRKASFGPLKAAAAPVNEIGEAAPSEAMAGPHHILDHVV